MLRYRVTFRVDNVEDASAIAFGQDHLNATFLRPSKVEGLTIRDADAYLDLFLVDLFVEAGLLNIDDDTDALRYACFPSPSLPFSLIFDE